MAKYQNKLGLEGIPRIKEIIPQDIGSFFGLFYSKNDEFIHFADTLKEWKRQGKCLADFVKNEKHKEAVLRDLYRLRDSIDLEVREARSLQGDLFWSESPLYFAIRDYFLEKTFPYEEGQLLAWEAPIQTHNYFDLVDIGGQCLIVHLDGAVTRIAFQFQELESTYDIFWEDSTTGEKDDGYWEDANVNIVGFKTPKTSGELVIIDQTRGITEYVPLP